MTANYPGSLDTDATVGGNAEPDAATSLDSSSDGHPTHSGLHKNLGEAVQELETKIGIGTSTPAANRVLLSTVTNQSSWGQITSDMIASGQSPTFNGLTTTSFTTGVATVNEVRGDDGSPTDPTFTFNSDEGNGMYLSGTDELSFTTGGNQALKIPAAGDLRPQREGVVLDAVQKTYWSKDPVEATGNDSEWVSYLGYYYMARNSSTAASKENITSDLGTHLTADMIDSVVPKMWNRTTAPGIPEIGPIADDIEDVSPFLAAHGTDADGDQILTGINKTAWMSLMTLALQDIRTRLAALEG